MERLLKEKNNQYVVMMRGITASGKSTTAAFIKHFFTERGVEVAKHSTDEFFLTEEGKYLFDPSKLSQYHHLNLEAFREDVKKGTEIVICDNTNLIPWQTEPYTQVAREYDYKIIFVDLPVRSLQEHIEAQKVTEARPDAHKIPETAILSMIRDYNNYKELLDLKSPINPKKHRRYVWCPVSKKNVLSDEVCKHFDLDYLISPTKGTAEEKIQYVVDIFSKLFFSQNLH